MTKVSPKTSSYPSSPVFNTAQEENHAITIFIARGRGVNNANSAHLRLARQSRTHSRLSPPQHPNTPPPPHEASGFSVQAYNPGEELQAYALTQSAMNNFSKGLAEELTPKGIRVDSVAPGPFWTVLQPSDAQPQEKIESFGQLFLLGRVGRPIELTGAYVFLASDEAIYVSDESLGRHQRHPIP